MVNGHQRPSNEVSRRAINSTTTVKYDGYIIICDFLGLFFLSMQYKFIVKDFCLFCLSEFDGSE